MNTNQSNGSNSHLEKVLEDTTKMNTDDNSLKVGICSHMSNQLIEDLFVTALEGGSNYWYMIRGEFPNKPDGYPLSTWLIQQVLNNGLEVEIEDVENDNINSNLLGKVNITNIQEAERRLIGSHPGHYAQIMGDNWDADNADVWFQLVVMQKVVYG